jgi:hypothetical protein
MIGVTVSSTEQILDCVKGAYTHWYTKYAISQSNLYNYFEKGYEIHQPIAFHDRLMEYNLASAIRFLSHTYAEVSNVVHNVCNQSQHDYTQ